MPKFPVDAPLERVVKSLGILGFVPVREGNHIALERRNPDGTRTPMTIPNHRHIKSSTLRTVLSQAGIARRLSLRIRIYLTAKNHALAI
jgi:predicted RNA binding protein YcfA (HicA-like mRNA interferase family)